MPAKFFLDASIIGTDAPTVSFRHFRKFISVPFGSGVSALRGGETVLLSTGALDGRLAELLYEVSASMNDEAR